ncbi:MAG: glycosyltransferase family 9 protein [Acetobacterales bacterium]
MARRVLVIKLGALGDFVQAFRAFEAIRLHHAGDRITLLTTAPFADLARRSPWFDEVWVDERPTWRKPGGWLALRRRLREAGFARVYDLQTSDRSSAYFALFRPGPRPEWSGIARGCSHPHANPDRDAMHTLDRQAEQLAMAGIPAIPDPGIAWLETDLGRFRLEGPVVLLIPGGSAHRGGKRWPAERYAAVATGIAQAGVTPLLLGGRDEADLHAEIAAEAPAVRSLAGQTALPDVASLGYRASFAVGNDTGPVHLIAATGCRTVVLFSSDSDPALCAPRGGHVTVLRRDSLADLPTGEVMAHLPL